MTHILNKRIKITCFITKLFQVRETKPEMVVCSRIQVSDCVPNISVTHLHGS